MTRRLAMRALGFAGLLAAGLGTTCATTMTARQTLRPFPPLACLRSSLEASPDVVEVMREFRGEDHGAEGYWVVLRDSTARDGRRYANLFREAPDRRERPEDRATRLTLSFSWPGFRRPPAAEERAAVVIASRVLTQLQTSCAPDTPAAPVVCSRGDGKWRPCTPSD